MKRRLLVFTCPVYVAILAGFYFFYQGGREVKSPKYHPNVVVATEDVVPPTVIFRDVTQEAGIDYTHHAGEYGKFLFPEIYGPGCGFFDYDNDGDQDLFIVDSGEWPHRRGPGVPSKYAHVLYENDGHGHFTEVGRKKGLRCLSYGQGVCFGDVDNDGFEDVYVCSEGKNTLYRNNGAKGFADMTARAGVECSEWSVSAAFLDYDRDGLLDLFVGNYVDWDIDTEAYVKNSWKNRPTNQYPDPQSFGGTFCRLYRNLGDFRFMDVSSKAGILQTHFQGKPSAKALGIAVCDYNEDGWPDIAVANDQVPDFLFKNQGDGTFREIAGEAGMATNANGKSRAGMGVSWGDYRNDGSIGFAVGNFTTEMVGLYLSRNRSDIFADVAAIDGIGEKTLPPVSWGLFFFDYDLDGWLDLFIANGHTQKSVEYNQGVTYKQPSQLFWNCGRKSRSRWFCHVDAEHCGEDLGVPRVGRGAAYADVDGDGDLDIFMTTNRGKPVLFRNETQLGNHYLRVRLEGRKSNRSAIGARLRLRVGRTWQRREVVSGASYASQSETVQTFGLGKNKSADELEVFWPSGLKTHLENLPADQTVRIVEGAEPKALGAASAK